MTAGRVDVVEFTDPLCSVAWGAEPLLRLLRWRYEPRLRWRIVMGGLAGNLSTSRPDWTRAGAAIPMSAYWKRVTKITGQPYPKPMHLMVQSTDPAGRAFKAAERQGGDVAERLLRRMRESIFLFGRGPQTPEEFGAIADNISGLDKARWLSDMQTPAIEAAYRADWEEARQPNDFVRAFKSDAPLAGVMRHSDGRDRYDFPTLLFRGPGGEHTAPGWVAFNDYVDAMEAALPGSTATPRPDPSPEQALARWGVLTAKELETLCGADAAAPASAVAHDWGDGVVYLSPDEATAWGLADAAA